MSTESQILGYFIGQGYTRAQAAGIAGNLMQESSDDADEAGGYLAQWGGARLTALETFARSKGVAAAGNTTVQLEFITHELNTTEAGANAALRSTSTPSEAARVFSEQYERPGTPDIGNRERYADEAAGVTPTTGLSSGASSSSTSSTGSKSALGQQGLLGLGVKGITYLALIAGAIALLWMGSKTFLQPKPPAVATA